MIEVSSLVALIVAEVMVGLLVLSGLLLLFTLLRKGRIRKAAAHLAERVKADKAKREQRLKALLEDGYHYKETELEQILRNMMQTEMLLYQNVINGFLKDDQLHLQQIDVDVENLVLSYQGLRVPESPPDGTTQLSDSDGEDLVKLKEENERLSEELRVTMDTMGRMLNEYSTMFSGGETEQAAVAEVEESQQEDVATEQAGQETIEQAPMDETASIADSIMGDMPLGEMDSTLDSDTDIPDLNVDELQSSSYLEQGDDFESESAESVPVAENPSLDDDAVEADEEVSEIIDEVMEMADAMAEEAASSDSQGEAGESMVDDLEKIDIEIPEDEETLSDDADAAQDSLEEEWAKLLEEDEASKKGD
jgi:hypothetical protein